MSVKGWGIESHGSAFPFLFFVCEELQGRETMLEGIQVGKLLGASQSTSDPSLPPSGCFLGRGRPLLVVVSRKWGALSAASKATLELVGHG